MRECRDSGRSSWPEVSPPCSARARERTFWRRVGSWEDEPMGNAGWGIKSEWDADEHGSTGGKSGFLIVAKQSKRKSKNRKPQSEIRQGLFHLAHVQPAHLLRRFSGWRWLMGGTIFCSILGVFNHGSFLSLDGGGKGGGEREFSTWKCQHDLNGKAYSEIQNPKWADRCFFRTAALLLDPMLAFTPHENYKSRCGACRKYRLTGFGHLW